jgi:hypothetical protein
MRLSGRFLFLHAILRAVGSSVLETLDGELISCIAR